MTHVSPSQIEKWRMCRRAWAYSRTIRTANKCAKFGSDVHAKLEAWLLNGTVPDPNTPEGACAIVGLPFLPVPGSGLVEYPLKFWSDGVGFSLEHVDAWVEYVGRIDLIAEAPRRARFGRAVRGHRSSFVETTRR
mgnify:CR=1 FL=1